MILTGIRVSTLLTLGIAAIAAAINGPGLGNLIFQGPGEGGGELRFERFAELPEVAVRGCALRKRRV